MSGPQFCVTVVVVVVVVPQSRAQSQALYVVLGQCGPISRAAVHSLPQQFPFEP